ncbi:MAG: HPr family phosphocarrier protein, partial [Desulfobacterales bacterium]|nr:HPr family phosphocarrier protein [Desulfobacterales bacterium]
MEKNKDVCGITFNEKVRMFSHDYLKCCKYISEYETSQHIFTKKLYSKLISTSQLLEDFLDFHGAKNNQEWYFYRELSATIRHWSISSYSQKHISNRLVFYNLKDTEEF